jgi:hypothetical protein
VFWLAGICIFLTAVLAGVFAMALHFARGRLLLAALAPAAATAAFGAFAGAATAALASSVSPAAALLRGGLRGFGMGLVFGALCAGVVLVARRVRAGRHTRPQG